MKFEPKNFRREKYNKKMKLVRPRFTVSRNKYQGQCHHSMIAYKPCNGLYHFFFFFLSLSLSLSHTHTHTPSRSHNNDTRANNNQKENQRHQETRQERQRKMEQQKKIVDKTNVEGPRTSARVPDRADNKKKKAATATATTTAAAAAAAKNTNKANTNKAYAANNSRKPLSVENIKHTRKFRIDNPTKKTTKIWDEELGKDRLLQDLLAYTVPDQPHLGLPLELCLLYKDRIVLPYDHECITQILDDILVDLFGTKEAVIDALKDEEHRGKSHIINKILQFYLIDNNTLESFLHDVLFNEKVPPSMSLYKANNNRKGFTESNLRHLRTALLQQEVPKTLWIDKYDGKPGEKRQLRDMSIYEAPKKPHLNFPIDICVTIRHRPIIPIDFGRTGDGDDDDSQLHSLLVRLVKDVDLPDINILVEFMMTNPKRIVPLVLEKFLEFYVIENATLIDFFTSQRHFVMGNDDSQREVYEEDSVAIGTTRPPPRLAVADGSSSGADDGSNRTIADVDRDLKEMFEQLSMLGRNFDDLQHKTDIIEQDNNFIQQDLRHTSNTLDKFKDDHYRKDRKHKEKLKSILLKIAEKVDNNQEYTESHLQDIRRLFVATIMTTE